MKSAAELVEAVRFAVFLGFVMLLAVFLETVAAGDRLSECVDVGGVMDVGFFGASELVEERFVGLVAVLAFGVILYGARCAALSHRGPPGGVHSGKAEATGLAGRWRSPWLAAERSLTLAAKRSLRSL